MDVARQQNSSGDEPQDWPLTPELIGKILGIEADAKMDAETTRQIVRVFKGLSSKGYTGCITFVFDDGRVEPEGYKSSIVYIGPTAR